MPSHREKFLYADANATSRVRPEVASWLVELQQGQRLPGNPSSVHQSGQYSRRLIRQARSSLLMLLNSGSQPTDQTVVFTSGATEGSNLLVNGFLGRAKNSRVVCSTVEHPSMLEPIKAFEARGGQVSWIDPNPRGGAFNLDRFCDAVAADTALVVMMLANNETGRIYPVVELCKKLRGAGYQGAIVSDATQALSKSALNATELFAAGLDGLAISSHKIGGPTGVGAIILSKDSNRCRLFEAQQLGGNQEFGFRAGTENVAGIAGFGIAAEAQIDQLVDSLGARSVLREQLWDRISSDFKTAVRITPPESESTPILCNTLLVSFPGWRGDDLVVALDLKNVCCSTGAACASGKQGVSHVLNELGLPEAVVRGAVRFSLDWDATEEDVTEIAERLNSILINRVTPVTPESHANC